jgi:nucleoside-diphosphate-sugar epimerase
MIGGHAALYLRSLGHDVAIASRTPPPATCALAQFPHLKGDYVAGDLRAADLAEFETVVFAAGNDPRHVTPGSDTDAHWQRANIDGVPRFFARLRDAGVRNAINVGSFYPQAAPALVERNSYIRSRKLACDGARVLARPGFRVISVNAPFVVGSVPGLVVPMFQYYTRYALGQLAPMPRFAPPGGVNFISTQSLSEAVAGALARGESGRAYLVGDENLSFQEYFGQFFRAAGDLEPLPTRDETHPLLPDYAMPWGRGRTLYYEPDPREAALLGYRRNDITRTICEVVAQCRNGG